ncbi:MAG: SRPBCC domain-containing protein [Chloroflexota bacterium]
MNPVTIHKTIEIAAPPRQVWRYVGTATGLCEWWGVEIKMDEKEGGYFEEIGEENGRAYHRFGQVTTFNPPYHLSIQIQHLDDNHEWPAKTEIDIRLEENIIDADKIHTNVSITHRPCADERDNILPDCLMPVYPNTGSGYGPTMMLPQDVGMVEQPSAIAVNLAVGAITFTLQELYQWCYQQDKRWQQHLVRLTTLFGEKSHLFLNKVG